jgi:antitoxin component of RelBE/YafQ-DinJ toxin-antitoxin module
MGDQAHAHTWRKTLYLTLYFYAIGWMPSSTEKVVMEKRKPRLSIQLDQNIKSTYEQTAGLMGIPASQFIRQLLTESEPSIKAMQGPLKTALKGKNTALKQLSGMMDGLKEEATEHQMDILDAVSNGNKKK